MTYRVEIERRAGKAIVRLPRRTADRILDKIEALAHDPRPVGVVQMTGVDAYRVRVGDYRIVYTIRDSVLLVTVIRVGHRREVYEDR